MINHTISLDIAGYAPQHSAGSAAVVHYDFQHRLGRAAKVIGLVWLVAIPIMCIPFLLILTLPAAIALTVFFAWERLTALDHAQRCEGKCPDCGALQTFDLPEKFELPLHVECSGCCRELTLTDLR
jgi:hypothetical protein